MSDSDELRWAKSTANDLNNLLQVISESSQMLERLCQGTHETDRYFTMLRSAVDRAAEVTQSMVQRVSEGDFAPPPTSANAPGELAPRSGQILPYNSQGPLELILVVDDEEYVTMLAQRVLADEGYRVLTAKDGFDALDIFRRLKDEIALVVLDFTMPVLDGNDVFTEMLEIDPKVSVVLSSGFTEKDRLGGMLARGLRGFIPKPYTSEKLLAEIRTTLDAIKSERTGARRIL